MKILPEKYPKGTYKGQKTAGKYIHEYLYQNLSVLAKAIVQDNTFLMVIYSSTLEVGTGKSVLATQIGEAWTEVMKKLHNIDVPFTMNNIVWRPKQLVERAFEVPPYSCILVDEWEDAHYWSELGISLRQFFRKCRQLNLFIIVIIPNWFQLPMSYAVSRSIFALDVRFEDGFHRGYFYFYGFNKKRELYVKGKREHNYFAAQHEFAGRFVDGYGVNEDEYRKAKLADTMKYDEEEKPLTETQIKVKIFRELSKNLPDITQKRWGVGFGVSKRTISRWNTQDIDRKEGVSGDEGDVKTTYTNKSIKKEVIWDEEKPLEPLKKEKE